MGGVAPMGSTERLLQAMLSAGIALHRLAQAHERRGDAEQAAYYYEMNLQRMDAEQVAGSEAVDALLFLAAHHKVSARALRVSSSCGACLYAVTSAAHGQAEAARWRPGSFFTRWVCPGVVRRQ